MGLITKIHGGVYHSAKIRNFKQITTSLVAVVKRDVVFITLQRYEILSKSQHQNWTAPKAGGCLSLCKDTKF